MSISALQLLWGHMDFCAKFEDAKKRRGVQVSYVFLARAGGNMASGKFMVKYKREARLFSVCTSTVSR